MNLNSNGLQKESDILELFYIIENELKFDNHFYLPILPYNIPKIQIDIQL